MEPNLKGEINNLKKHFKEELINWNPFWEFEKPKEVPNNKVCKTLSYYSEIALLKSPKMPQLIKEIIIPKRRIIKPQELKFSLRKNNIPYVNRILNHQASNIKWKIPKMNSCINTLKYAP